MADVFISYSRQDEEFVARLHKALEAQGRDAWVDTEDIPPTVEWEERIQKGIEEAGAFVYVLSPESVDSMVCRREVELAVENHKRLIPLLYREMPKGSAPESLGKLNWLDFRDPERFDRCVATLVEQLDVDHDWVEAHTYFLTQANRWEREGREKSLLLKGAKLKEAETWLAQGPEEEPKPTALQGSFILASRQAVTRRQRWTLGVVTAGLIISIGLGLLAFYQYRVAEQRRQIALSRQLAAQAGILLSKQPQTSVLLAVESLQRHQTGEGLKALWQGRAALPRQFKRFQLPGEAKYVSHFGGQGKYLATVMKDQTIRIWAMDSGRQLAQLKAPEEINTLMFSFEGHWLAVGSGTKEHGILGNKILISDINTKQELASLQGGKAMTWACDPQGRRLAIAWYVPGQGHSVGHMEDYVSQAMVQVLEPATGREVSRISVNTILSLPRTLNLAFSPDGQRLAIGGVSVLSKDCTTALVWDLDNHLEVARFDHTTRRIEKQEYSPHEGFQALAFSPNGRLLATSTEYTTRLWDVATGQEGVLLEIAGDYRALVFSPDSRFLAIYCEITAIDMMWAFHGTFDPHMRASQRTVKVWDIAKGQQMASLFHDDTVWMVEFSPDSRLLATMSGNLKGGAKTVRLWQPDTGRVMASWEDANLARIGFQGDGEHFVTYGWNNAIQIWKISPSEEIAHLDHSGPVQKLVFSPEGKFLATGEDKTVRLWEMATGREVTRSEEPGGITSLDFSPDGRWLVSGSGRKEKNPEIGHITLWELGKDKQKAQLALPSIVSDLTFSPNSRWLATGRSDATVSIWEVTTIKEALQIVHPLEEKKPFGLLAYSPNGCCLAATSSSDAFIWYPPNAIDVSQLPAEHRVNYLRAHRKKVTAIVFSPNGNWLATASVDNTIRLWEAETGREMFRMLHEGGVSTVAFSPDSRYLVSGSEDHTAKIWETVSGREMASLKHEGPVTEVAFSPCGRFIASAEECPQQNKGCRATVRLWEASTGEDIAQLTHDGNISSLAFSPDGELLASASQDGTARLWHWRPEDLVRQACSRLTRNLTRDEWQQYLPGEPYYPTCPDLPVQGTKKAD